MRFVFLVFLTLTVAISWSQRVPVTPRAEQAQARAQPIGLAERRQPIKVQPRSISITIEDTSTTGSYRLAVWSTEAATEIGVTDRLTTRATELIPGTGGALTLTIDRLPVDPLVYEIAVAENDLTSGKELRRVYLDPHAAPDPLNDLDAALIEAINWAFRENTKAERDAIATGLRNAALRKRNQAVQARRDQLDGELIDLSDL